MGVYGEISHFMSDQGLHALSSAGQPFDYRPYFRYAPLQTLKNTSIRRDKNSSK